MAITNNAINQEGWQNFTPTITLVGGSGNTVPTFATFLARYQRIGNTCFVSLNFSNASGGTAGAGTGVFNVALPIVSSANAFVIGDALYGSSGSTYASAVSLGNSASTLNASAISGTTLVQLTGQSFATGSRQFLASFFYEV
jgi:hypothetical protein